MSFVTLVLISSQFVSPNNGYKDIININLPDQYNSTEMKCSGHGDCRVICDENRSCYGKQIICPEHFLCDVTCSGVESCETAEIICPYGESCTINCNNDRSCQSTIIQAQYSSQFTLNDCSTGELTCNGMSIYFPPNNGNRKSLINGGNNLISKNNKELHFYAIFGWLDINIINYNGNNQKFEDNTNSIMHCLPSYTKQCYFSLDSLSCLYPDDSCNNPPTQQPTTAPTTSPTLSPIKKPTINPPNKQNIITTTFILQQQQQKQNNNLNQVDILWLVTALLLSVLCFIMVILSYYIYHSRYKTNNNSNKTENENININIPKKRKRTLSISNLKGLKRNHKSHISEHDQTKMNKLIISALSQNSNSKYVQPIKPKHLPKRKKKYNNLVQTIKTNKRPETIIEYPNEEYEEYDIEEGTDTLNMTIPTTSISNNKNNNNNNNNNPYPNGNLNQLHGNDNINYSINLPSPYSYLDKQQNNKSTSINSINSIDGNNPYLTEPQIYSHGVGKLLFNHQQQINNKILFINTKLTENESQHNKSDDNSNANSQITQHNHHQNTLSVEIAANKILSPLSTVTASSLNTDIDTQINHKKNKTEIQQETVINKDLDFTLINEQQQQQQHKKKEVEDNNNDSSDGSSGSSSDGSSSSSSTNTNTTTTTTTTTTTATSSSSSDVSSDEDEELKRSEICISNEQKLQEWITDTDDMDDMDDMDDSDIDNNNINNNNSNNKYNYLHHERNVTMVIKHQNNNTLPLSHIDIDTDNISEILSNNLLSNISNNVSNNESTQKVAITIGDNVYESPFNDEDHDNTIWTKHIYKNSINTVKSINTINSINTLNTSISSKKTFGIECPISVDDNHDNDNLNLNSVRSIHNDNHTNDPTASTLEIQGLINV